MVTKWWYSNASFSPAVEEKVVTEPQQAAYRDTEAIDPQARTGGIGREKASRALGIAFAVVLGCVAIYPIVRMLIG